MQLFSIIYSNTINLFRSLGITLDNSSFLKSEYRGSLLDGTSIAAVNPEGRVMAVRVGNIIRW